MSVSDEERETLHTILDALLNARNSLERIDPKELSPGNQYRLVWSEPRRDLCWQASHFLKRIIGPKLHQSELGLLFDTELEENALDSELPATLANSIRSFLPLFLARSKNDYDGQGEVIMGVIEDLMGIHWGDEPRFFSIQPRRQGQHKRLYRLNSLRLKALDWDKYLAAVGMPSRERHRVVADAFNAEWDAIRKWEGLVEEQYGFRSWPPRNPESALREFQENPEGIFDAIKRDGADYWREKSAASLEK